MKYVFLLLQQRTHVIAGSSLMGHPLHFSLANLTFWNIFSSRLNTGVTGRAHLQLPTQTPAALKTTRPSERMSDSGRPHGDIIDPELTQAPLPRKNVPSLHPRSALVLSILQSCSEKHELHSTLGLWLTPGWAPSVEIGPTPISGQCQN